MRTALYCRECWSFLRYSERGNGVLKWITCDRCLERLAERDKITGRQPAICQHCREPFEASRQGQRFCRSSCRARAWRKKRQRVIA